MAERLGLAGSSGMSSKEDETMTTQITATVVGGMLKPDERLQLAEQTRVNLTIEPLAERAEPLEAWQSLKAWIRESPLHCLGRRVTREELHERR
jgi:hypothetical protein